MSIETPRLSMHLNLICLQFLWHDGLTMCTPPPPSRQKAKSFTRLSQLLLCWVSALVICVTWFNLFITDVEVLCCRIVTYWWSSWLKNLHGPNVKILYMVMINLTGQQIICCVSCLSMNQMANNLSEPHPITESHMYSQELTSSKPNSKCWLDPTTD